MEYRPPEGSQLDQELAAQLASAIEELILELRQALDLIRSEAYKRDRTTWDYVCAVADEARQIRTRKK